MKKLTLFFLFFVFTNLLYSGSGNFTFYATGDMHFQSAYWSSSHCEDDNKTNFKILNLINKRIEDGARGVLIAGDVTQHGKTFTAFGWSELRCYKETDLITHNRKKTYDGFGNHDLIEEKGTLKSGLKEYFSENYKNAYRSSNGVHYSWNWDNIHFVHLNLVPADSCAVNTEKCKEKVEYLGCESKCESCMFKCGDHTIFQDASGFSPYESLDFLKKDLEKHVNKNSTPVVLIFHYGFDGFSKKWWSDKQRDDFFKVIKEYNIVAMFTGHDHPSNLDTNYIRPIKPDKNDAYRIPTFISGATDKEIYLKIDVKDNEMRIQRYKNTTKGEGKCTADYSSKSNCYRVMLPAVITNVEKALQTIILPGLLY